VNIRLMLIRIGKALGFALGCLVFTVLVLVGTQPGTRWLVNTSLNLFAASDALKVSMTGLEGTLSDRMTVTELSVQAGDARITAGDLVLAWNPLALLDDELDIRTLSAARLMMRLPESDSTPQGADNPLDVLFRLPVSVRLRDVDVRSITLAGESPVVLEQVRGKATLEAGAFTVEAHIERDARTLLDAELSLTEEMALTGNLQWQAGINEIDGKGLLQLAGSVDSMDLTHQLESPLAVTTEGKVVNGLLDNSGVSFNLAHRFDDITGRALGVDAINQLSGELITRGNMQQMVLSLVGDLDVARLGELSVQSEARLAGSALDIGFLTLQGDALAASVSGMAELGSNPQIRLSWELADFSNDSLVSGVVLEGINGNGSLQFIASAEGSETSLALDGLEGQLNGYALTGMGEVSLKNGQVSQIDLDLASGGNRLQLQGGLEPELNLDWSLQAPVFGRLLQGLEGEVSGTGRLTGSRSAPELNGAITSTGLVYQAEDINVALQSMTGDAVYGSTGNHISLRLADLSLDAPQWRVRQSHSEIRLSGSPENHEISLITQGPDPALRLAGSGQFDGEGWLGRLGSLSVESSYGDWQLQEPLALQLSSQHILVGDHCWQWLDISLCGELNWTPETGARGQWQLTNLPLVYFNRSLPEDVAGLENAVSSLANRPAGVLKQLEKYGLIIPAGSTVEGGLDVDLNFDGVGAASASGYSLSAALSPVDLRLGFLRPVMEEGEQTGTRVERYGLDDMAFSVNRVQNGWALESRFSVYVPESSGLDFQGAFQGKMVMGDREDLEGEFDLAFSNIAWLEALVPNLREVKGRFSADGQVKGNLQRPLLQVDAKLEEGAVMLPEYGLNLEQIALDIHSEGENDIDLHGSARSGEGEATVASHISTPFLTSRQFTADIQGANFLLVDKREAKVTVNPDLHLVFQDQQLSVTGVLDVPLMNLDLREGQSLVASGGVAVSRDAVITVQDSSRPRQGNSAESVSRIPVSGNVRLGLGDAVHFQGFGLDLTLAGSLDMEQALDRSLLAHGELAIPTGTYGLYGQELSITDGKLLFLGNPLNPALDIRALRQTPDAEVGVQMNGTVSKIRAQLYSTPTLPESEILSLLITGKSFSNGAELGGQDGESMLGAIALLGLEQGQGLTGSVSSKLGLDTVAINSGENYRDSSLGLGKYIRPNLFMRYDIGLFDRQNVLTLDYLLTNKLKLQVENGVSQSVDLTYTVEK